MLDPLACFECVCLMMGVVSRHKHEQELTGLAKMRREADAVEMLWLDDDEEFEDDADDEDFDDSDDEDEDERK